MTTLPRIVTTFMELVQIDSPSGYESDMAQNVANRLKKFGLHPHIDTHGNVIAQIPGNTDKSALIFNAHLDTVEPSRGVRPIIKGDSIVPSTDTILGADNKSAVAAVLDVVETLYEEKFINNRPLDIVFTVSEETSTNGPRWINYDLLRTQVGYSFDASNVVGTITMASPFYNRFDFIIEGTAAHAARPHLGNNALDIVIQSLILLPSGKIDEETVRNLRIADGNVQNNAQAFGGITLTRNTIPHQIIGVGEVRSYNEKKVEKYTDEVENIFKQAITNSRKPYTFHFVKQRENAGFFYKDTNPLVQQAEQIFNKLHIPVNKEYSMGCYDANVFAEYGVTLLNLGDGSSGAHTKEEQITIHSLTSLAEVIYNLATA